MLRRRRGEADDPAAPAAGPAASATAGHQYRMVEKLVSIGDDFFIENDQGSGSSKSTARPCECGTP